MVDLPRGYQDVTPIKQRIQSFLFEPPHRWKEVQLRKKQAPDCHKNKPRAVNAPGVHELMPQLAGFCDPGGEGVEGWGPPSGSGLLKV
jgi:hypothetical protein